jgi:hypothetical protein
VSPVKYELGFYIPEDDILHSHCQFLQSYAYAIKSSLSYVVSKTVCIAQDCRMTVFRMTV